jgi:hypothetical protein
MAEAFAAAGGVVRIPAIVLYQDPPVGFLSPVVGATGWGRRAAEIPGLRLPRP